MSFFSSVKASQYFSATVRNFPQEASVISHKLMIKAGFVQQIASGIYAWLPMGFRILEKIQAIIREEHDKAGCVEILAPTLQPSTLWKKSGRYDDYGKEMLRFLDRHERELIYGPTAEEIFTEVFQTHVTSYRQLPQKLYNIQWKFRDEVRPRFGVMRGREFLMKDGYSFDLTKEAAQESYRIFSDIYLRIFSRMGLRAIPVRATTGPIGGDLSHEFHVIAEMGESKLYYDRAINGISGKTLEEFLGYYAMADDKHIADKCPILSENLVMARGIEVGHVFFFGTKYSEAMGAMVTTASGQRIPAEMGSYGIGVSRLFGALIEVFHDEYGIKWPVSVAPFTVCVMSVGEDHSVLEKAEDFWQKLQQGGVDTFYDDRSISPGEKFTDADLIGYPYHVFISNRTIQNGFIEIKERATGERVFLSQMEALDWIFQRCPKNGYRG